ncbi:MAG: hypothetical protein ABEI32_05945 [Halothece sp.]
MKKNRILMSLSIVAFGLTTLSVHAQTTQQATQDAYVEGNDNEVNQVINQYYYQHPGKGASKRKDPNTRVNGNQQPSTNQNERSKKPGNSAWGHSRGPAQNNSKK